MTNIRKQLKESVILVKPERIMIMSMLMDIAFMMHQLMKRCEKAGKLMDGEADAVKENMCSVQAMIGQLLELSISEVREASEMSQSVKPELVDEAVIMAESQNIDGSQSTIEGDA